jgi:hypothetical protein
MLNFQFEYQNAIRHQFTRHQKAFTTGSLSKFLQGAYSETFKAVMAIADLSDWPSIPEEMFKEYFESIRKEVLATTVTTIDDLNMLSKNKNTWLRGPREAEIEWNYTARYLKHLSNTGRAKTVVSEIDDSSKKILGKLGDPRAENSFLIKGLVEGDVQSGKTGNFNAVINRSIDAGYRLIIVLSGIMDDLRVQTQERIQIDVIGEGKKGRVGVGHIDTFGIDVGSSVQQANSITSEDADFSSPLEKANFSMKPINILVCKKNVSIMKNLLIWINENLPGGESKHATPFLIIDDEADNASLNNEGHKGQEYASKINGHIRALLDLFHKRSYLGYTATPFANVIQDRNDVPNKPWILTYKTKQQEKTVEFSQINNLFPDDFIVQLNSPTNYVGAQRIFETLADDGVAKLPVVFSIDDYCDDFPSRVIEVEVDNVIGVERFDSKADWDSKVGKFGYYRNFISYSEYRKGTRAAKSLDSFPNKIPDSLKQSVMCFILGIAVRELRQPQMVTSNLYQPHNTMLIHISRFTRWQSKTERLLKLYYLDLVSKLMMDKPNAPGSIYLQFEKVWRKYYYHIVLNIREYLPKGYEDEFMTPTSFNSVLPGLIDAAKGVDILALNSQTNDELEYKKDNPKKVIAIGGNRLSRGFTLEGLITSYFVRTTNYSDSLLQMGRWFGYRPGYLDCCKLFTSQDLIDKYDSTTLCIEELKAEFKKMDDSERTPSDFEIRVRTHEGVLQITRPSILKNTDLVKWSYQDSLQMSTSINVAKAHVFSVWEDFKTNISRLMVNAERRDTMLCKQVSSENIVNILQGSNNFDPTKCELMTAYIKKCNEKGLLKNWTIAIKMTGTSKSSLGVGKLAPVDTGLQEDLTLAIRRGPKPGERFYDELINNLVFKATSKSANIMSSGKDMAASLTNNEAYKATNGYYKEQAKSFIKLDPKMSMDDAIIKAKKKTIPERVYREKLSPREGVLIVYLFDSYYSFLQERGAENPEYADWVNKNEIDLNVPLVGFALGFPPISRMQDPCGVYVKGDYKLETVTDPDEDEADDYEEGESSLPDDMDS